MIYDFWWEPDDKSSHFLVEISAPREVVERMVQGYLRSNSRDSFVGFLRAHNIPARNLTPISVGFYEMSQCMSSEHTLAPDFAHGAEIRTFRKREEYNIKGVRNVK